MNGVRVMRVLVEEGEDVDVNEMLTAYFKEQMDDLHETEKRLKTQLWKDARIAIWLSVILLAVGPGLYYMMLWTRLWTNVCQ